MNAPILTALLLAGIAVFAWGVVEAFAYQQATESMGGNPGCLVGACGLLVICIAIFGLLS